MSDQKNDDQQDFDSLYSVSDDLDSDHRHGGVVDDESAEPLADFSDIDDGMEEDGIFAAPVGGKEKPRKSSSVGLLFSVAALAIVGAGGYLYTTNPAVVDQIKNNFSDTTVDAGVKAPSFEMAETTSSEIDLEDLSAPVPAILNDDMPPQPDAINSLGEERAANEGATTQTAQDLSPPPVLEEDVVVEPSIVDSSSIISEDNVPEIVLDVVPQPVVEPVVDEKEANVQIFKPEKVRDDSVKVVDDVPSDDFSVQEDVAETVQRDVFFDAPPGKMMEVLPAPSLNAKRGKNESIIIVSSSRDSSSKPASKKRSHSEKVVIETTSLDSKIIAAGRALKLERFESARQLYDEVYALNPRDARILMGRAILFQKMGNDEQAISSYEELLAVDSGNTDAIVNMAGLIRKKYPAVALGKLLDLRQKYPDNAAIAAQLGVAYADTGNIEDAFRYLSMASGMEPTNAQHYFNMAIVAERGRDIPRAISSYEKALEVDAIYGSGRSIPRDMIYDRLTRLRGS